MTKGKIKYYNAGKGFGFITADETKEEFFFHCKELLYEPCGINDRVSFIVTKSEIKPGKLCATEIEKLR